MSGSEEIKEINQSGKLIATYIRSHTTDTSGTKSDRIDVDIPKGPSTWVMSLVGAFMPVGYPDSVTEDYTAWVFSIFFFFCVGYAFASTIAGLLASRAVLQGLGVGDSTASATHAVLLSILQESAGRISTILFAHRLGSALEPECKKYRLMADIFNDVAMILDCISPAFPKIPRVFLLSASSVCKSLCGVAAGSSKASLSAHFAKMGNLAELNAKDASQETLISLLGMLVGTFVVSRISSQVATWIALLSLLSIHLGTNYMAVRSVTMRTLNRQRANLVISSFLSNTGHEKNKTGLPSPREISLQERIFERDGALRNIQGAILAYCKVGTSLQELLSSISTPTAAGNYAQNDPILTSLLSIYKSQGYIMWYSPSRHTFLVILKEGTAPQVQLDAWFHAIFAVTFREEKKKIRESESEKMDNQNILNWMKQSLEESEKWRAEMKFYERLERIGWDLNTPAIEVTAGTRLVVGGGEERGE
ncbi:uncharacterized protein EAF02_006212 [Botrytis sinoallii]|uniref:uncharacterized protein n=1 Tax=Botrytis sinoallii TaxID=1463999 RepID=UPI001900D2E6|nr:uncharacterized protein EAF02_006212 [Botrytis sinoallii]KAF7882849.1 hypothetical protein EAF02_006212 [Botrytis sinoallii]